MGTSALPGPSSCISGGLLLTGGRGGEGNERVEGNEREVMTAGDGREGKGREGKGTGLGYGARRPAGAR